MAKLFKVIDKQLYLGQGCENVYWYATSSNTVKAVDVGNAFNTQIIAPLRNLQSNQLTHESLYVKEMLYGTDVVDGQQTGSNAGTLSTDAQSPFDAFGFGLSPSSGQIRKGSKRYAGLVEGSTALGQYTSAFKVALGLFASYVASNIVIPALAATLVPMVVRVTNSPAGGWLTSQIIGYVAHELSTQNSRKRGKGGGPLTFGDGVHEFKFNDTTGSSETLIDSSYVADDSELNQIVYPAFEWLFLPSSTVEPSTLD